MFIASGSNKWHWNQQKTEQFLFRPIYDIINLVFQRILTSGSKNLLSFSHYTKNLDLQWAFLFVLSSVIGSVDYCVGQENDAS